MKRWMKVIQEGNLGGREIVYPAALSMVKEKPMFGWGLINSISELESRTHGIAGVAHNLFLDVLLESGIFGLFVFVSGLFLCVKNSFRSRLFERRYLPFALMMGVLAINMGLSWQTHKMFWIVMAIASSGAKYSKDDSRR
jgi:O-antigen ligase